jgi:hypothetical protein
MAVQINEERAYAYAELLEILEFTEDEAVNKIPSKLLNVFKKCALPTYEKHLNPNIPLEEQNLSEKTSALIVLLTLNYWCESEEQKKALKESLKGNDARKEAILKEKYSYEKMFNNSQIDSSTPQIKVKEINTENLPMDYSSFPWYKKIFTSIKNFFFKLFNKANNPT